MPDQADRHDTGAAEETECFKLAYKPMARPNLYVMYRFLEALCEPEREHCRTSLQMRVGLNYSSFNRHLGHLLDQGFVTIRKNGSGRLVIRITGEGLRFFEALKRALGKEKA